VRVDATPADEGKRLDHFLQERLPEFSRSRLQDWIKAGHVAVHGKQISKTSYAVRSTDIFDIAPQQLPTLKASPEDIPLDVLYEDEHVIAINKPAGMVVHAGAGQHSGTLVNALLHRFGALSSGSSEERPGIVHRIDKETSGVLLIARNDLAHRALAEQFSSRKVEKFYLTLVQGVVRDEQGRVDRKITRHPTQRTRMTASLEHGRTAITWWQLRERFQRHSYLQVRIGTGRTHQIRVHMASIGHPVAGDTLYGAARTEHGRFFLHAWRIAFLHPATGTPVEVEAPLPLDLQEWLKELPR
jgi:23S rRNA pseudouridine1911/1915/1917 synthase